MDVSELAKAISFLADNKGLVPDMKVAARAYAEQKREWTLHEQDIHAVFEGLQAVETLLESDWVRSPVRYRSERLNWRRLLMHIVTVNVHRLRGKMIWAGNLRHHTR